MNDKLGPGVWKKIEKVKIFLLTNLQGYSIQRPNK